MEIEVDFGKTCNPLFEPLLDSDARYLIIYGGAGSGKSWFAAQKIIIRCLSEPGHRVLVLRKSHRSHRVSTYQLLRDVCRAWKLDAMYTARETDLQITFKDSGSTILFGGCNNPDDVEKLKSVQGITAIWIEEATQLTREDFQQIDLRLRGEMTHYKQLILTFNPISSLSWLKSRFFDRPCEDTHIHHSTYRDNRFIDSEYSGVLEGLADVDKTFHQVYALGEWGVLGNLIFTNWDADCPPVGEFAGLGYWDGADFGFNDPSVWLRTAVRDRELYILAEVYQRGLTNAEFIERVRAHGGHAPLAARLTCESAEPARIVEFQRAGFAAAPAVKGPHSVRHGIDVLRRTRLHVNPDCVNTIAELNQYKWREDRDGRTLDEPVPFANHAMDALRYAVEPIAGLLGAEFAATDPERWVSYDTPVDRRGPSNWGADSELGSEAFVNG